MLFLLNQLGSFRDFSLSLSFPLSITDGATATGLWGVRGGKEGMGGMGEESAGTASVGEEAEWRGDRVELD